MGKDKKYREKLKADPERYEAYKQRERDRYLRKKERGIVKPINQLSERQQRQIRKTWRESKQRQHKRATDARKRLNFFQLFTPPGSPENVSNDTPPPQPNSTASTSSKRDRKPKLNRAACYRKLKILEDKLKEKDKKLACYRKRLSRANQSSKTSVSSDSPASKTRNLLHGNKKDLRKQIKLHFVLTAALKSSIKKHRSHTNLVNVLKSRVFKKYKLTKLVEKQFGVKHRTRKSPIQSSAVEAYTYSVKSFLERDDCSRLVAGKKSTKTKNKLKMQKRLLSDTLLNLHKKYLSEFPEYKISFSLFCRLRPFYILIPSINDRDTCVCIHHDNINLKIRALYFAKALQTIDARHVIDSVVCNSSSKDCMYGDCSKCRDKKVIVEESKLGEMVKWCKWAKRTEEREARTGEKICVKLTCKIEETMSVEVLLDELNKDLGRFCRHVYNVNHQYSQIRVLRQKLDSKSCLIHMDYSENYTCKLNSEIQSAHFGASHRQLSLHTVVVYLADDTLSFCTVSESARKDPPSIWAHLRPILLLIREKFPAIVNINFLSDGPSTQYKNKTNFFMTSEKIFDYGFNYGTWSFFESSHGKGAPDGIGAVVKRTADRIVANGRGISQAEDFISNVSPETKVKLYLKTSEDITNEEHFKYKNVKSVPGSMKIHQLIFLEKGSMAYRDVSCFSCGIKCACYDPRQIKFDSTETPSDLHNIKLISTDINQSEGAPAEPTASASVDLIGKSFELDESLIGKWCVVIYDDMFFPGVIQNVDEDEAEVSVMHRIGQNRYFLPKTSDVIWYEKNKIIALIDEPKKVTGRHCQIEPNTYAMLSTKFDDFM